MRSSRLCASLLYTVTVLPSLGSTRFLGEVGLLPSSLAAAFTLLSLFLQQALLINLRCGSYRDLLPQETPSTLRVSGGRFRLIVRVEMSRIVWRSLRRCKHHLGRGPLFGEVLHAGVLSFEGRMVRAGGPFYSGNLQPGDVQAKVLPIVLFGAGRGDLYVASEGAPTHEGGLLALVGGDKELLRIHILYNLI